MTWSWLSEFKIRSCRSLSIMQRLRESNSMRWVRRLELRPIFLKLRMPSLRRRSASSDGHWRVDKAIGGDRGARAKYRREGCGKVQGLLRIQEGPNDVGVNSFYFRYQLIIFWSCFNHPNIKLPEDSSILHPMMAKWPSSTLMKSMITMSRWHLRKTMKLRKERWLKGPKES